jgi:hypothetical protein
MTGKALKTALGLDKIRYVYIQKIMGIPLLAFVVTVDSRFPEVYLPIARVKNSKVTTISKVKTAGFENFIMQNYFFTPPVIIEDTNPIMNSGTLVIRRDIGAEYLLNKKMFEDVKNKLKFEVIEI